MLRLGHHGCQSTTNEMAVMVMGYCQEKVIWLIPDFGGGNDKFFKGHIKRIKEGGASARLRCICSQNAWIILVKELIFSNMTGLMHRTCQKTELLQKLVKSQISDHLVVVTFVQRNTVNDLSQFKICKYVYVYICICIYIYIYIYIYNINKMEIK